MKKILIVAATITAGIIGANIYVKHLYDEYIRTSEELLWEIEEMVEYHGIQLGDTVYEGDNWSDYCEAREALGLEYLEHYSKR